MVGLRDKTAESNSAEMSCTLGADIRRLRRERGMRLADLAAALGRSVGWLSQVERDLSLPAVTDLQDIARCLGLPLGHLFRRPAPEDERGYVVRGDAHRPVQPTVPGLVEDILSPDPSDPFAVIRTRIAPGSRLVQPVLRQTREVGFVVSGGLDIWIGGKRFEIGNGDSFRIGGEPFLWMNPHDAPCEIVWVIAPPAAAR